LAIRSGQNLWNRSGQNFRNPHLAALTGVPSDHTDGELVAQDLLREQTQLGFMDELWKASYIAFALD
jgi:hypothetical protein